MSRTMKPKRIAISQTDITSLARGCRWNNPITIALKEQVFPHAREILIHGDDEIFVDGLLIEPTHAMIQFIRDWMSGRKVVPMLLGFHVRDNPKL